MARVVLDAATWAMVRVAYEDTTESVTRIITRFGLGRQQLYDQIALENWQMRSTARVKTPADVPPRSVPPQGSVQVEAGSSAPAHKLDVPV